MSLSYTFAHSYSDAYIQFVNYLFSFLWLVGVATALAVSAYASFRMSATFREMLPISDTETESVEQLPDFYIRRYRYFVPILVFGTLLVATFFISYLIEEVTFFVLLRPLLVGIVLVGILIPPYLIAKRRESNAENSFWDVRVYGYLALSLALPWVVLLWIFDDPVGFILYVDFSLLFIGPPGGLSEFNFILVGSFVWVSAMLLPAVSSTVSVAFEYPEKVRGYLFVLVLYSVALVSQYAYGFHIAITGHPGNIFLVYSIILVLAVVSIYVFTRTVATKDWRLIAASVVFFLPVSVLVCGGGYEAWRYAEHASWLYLDFCRFGNLE